MPAQYRAIWSTIGGGTGYSVLHFTIAGNSAAAQQIAADTRAFFNSLTTVLVNDTTIQFDSEVLDLDEAGNLTAVWPVTPPAAIAGLGTGSFARAAGAVVNWGTGSIVAGRRLSGKTYIVPTAGNTFENDGLLTGAARTVIQNAADALISAGAANRPPRVWSRTHATSAVIDGASVPTQGAILRGRRD